MLPPLPLGYDPFKDGIRSFFRSKSYNMVEETINGLDDVLLAILRRNASSSRFRDASGWRRWVSTLLVASHPGLPLLDP